MNRKVCSVTVILIVIIIGLFKLGIALFEYNGKEEGKFVAEIYSIEEETKYMKSYTAKINKQKFILYINKDKDDLTLGDVIEFSGSFSKADGQRNFMGFDYNLYLKTKRISGVFKANNVKKIEKKNNLFFMWKQSIYNIKNEIIKTLRKNLKEENSALLSGILIGEDNKISEESMESFKKLGLTHMLAISGENFMYIILMFGIVSKKVKLKRVGYYCTIFIIFFFMELTGNSASVIRAGVMCTMAILAKLLHRRYDFWTSLATSVLIQIIYNPYSIFDVGLLLSYGGAAGIVLLYNSVNKIIKSKAISVIVSANIIILPISIYNFNEISTVFIFSNIIASFFVELATIIGFISILFRLKIIYFILDVLLTTFNLLIKTFSQIPFASVKLSTPTFASLIFYYSLIFLFINRRKIEKYYKRVVIMFIVLIFTLNINFQKIDSIINNKMFINFIDVGQGDCTLIRYKNKTIIIDGGGSADSNYDIGKNTLIPYLLDRKIKKIDYMIISHFDTDHYQGCARIMEELKVKTVIISKQGEFSSNYLEFKQIVNHKKIKSVVVGKGNKIKIDNDLYFDILWPNNSKLMRDNVLNNNSIVCKLHFNNFSCIFTGDIEEIAENQILKEYNARLKILNSTILKVGHHGSKTSSTVEFIEAVKPKIALIGVGKNNTFGHPNIDVVKRISDLGCKIYRTDQMGEIQIEVNKKGVLKIKSKICEK